jgi:hypothetical protein
LSTGFFLVGGESVDDVSGKYSLYVTFAEAHSLSNIYL